MDFQATPPTGKREYAPYLSGKYIPHMFQVYSPSQNFNMKKVHWNVALTRYESFRNVEMSYIF